MECAQLSDAQLFRLVREGGEISLPALRELEQRHFPAVRAFAAACVVIPSAGDALAGEAWDRALRLQDGSVTSTARSHALSVVLSTAADWTDTGQRSALKSDLAAWIDANVPQVREDAASAYLPRPSQVARAFESLPEHSRTALWHQAVEHDDSARIAKLLGAGSDEVLLLNRRARRELYNSYVQIHQNEMVNDRCRPFHRMVLAYADQTSIDTAADLAPHLEGCAYCSRAVAELGRMRLDCGALLAEALLPWGGSDYAASRLPASAGVVRVLPGTDGEGGEGGEGGEYREGHAGGLISGPQTLSSFRHTGFGGSRVTTRRRKGDRQRANRLARYVALIGLCSLAVAFAYAGTLRQGSPQSSESPPKNGPHAPASPRPAPTTATATATSTVTATRTQPPPPRKTARPSSPVDGPAIEWLFGKVNGKVTPDTSGNGRDGTLVGDPLPKAGSGGALEFDGQQSVTSGDAVVDTNHSFSVSARVKLRETDGFQTVVSQDGSRISGFSLQYDSDEDRWAMAIHDDDSPDSEKDQAVSESEPETGRWTQLTGVYDDPDDEIRLFVDGKLEDTSGHSGDWGAEGGFVAGRVLLDHQYAQGFNGAIDDVRAFRRALTSEEAAALAHDD